MYSLDNGNPNPSDVFYRWNDLNNDNVPIDTTPEYQGDNDRISPLLSGPPAYSTPLTIPNKRRPMREHCVNIGLIIVTFVILYNVMKFKNAK